MVYFYRVESVVNILLGVSFVLLTASVPKVTLLLVPAAIGFILTQIILVNLLDRRILTDYERKTVSMWRAVNCGTFIAALLTLVVIMIFNGGELQL